MAKSDNLRDKQFFLEQIDFTLNRELADGEGPHQALAAYTNRPYQDIIEKSVWYPSADHYIKHMYFHFYENGIAGALAAMSPCPWIYHQLTKKIIEENQFLNGNPFNNWITFYANDTVEELMENYFRMMDYYAQNLSKEKQADLVDAFVKSCQHERRFFQMAINQEKWED